MVAAGVDAIRLPKTETPEDIHVMEGVVEAAELKSSSPEASLSWRPEPRASWLSIRFIRT
jgi:citrate lyase beta subunit